MCIRDRPTKEGITRKFTAPRDPGNFNELPSDSEAAATSVEEVSTSVVLPVVEKLKKTDWTLRVLIYVGIGMGVVIFLLVVALVVLWRYNAMTRTRFVDGLAGLAKQWKAPEGTVESGNISTISSVPSGASEETERSEDSGISELASSVAAAVAAKKSDKARNQSAAALVSATAAAAALQAAKKRVEKERKAVEERKKAEEKRALVKKAGAAARAVTAVPTGEFVPGEAVVASSSPSRSALDLDTFLLSS